MVKNLQNTSTAVMQRRVEAHDSLDDFPTPPWATRALCEYVLRNIGINKQNVWEPCCNRGYMAKPLGEYFNSVYATDIHNYGYERMDNQVDFLFPFSKPEHEINWVIANPPFRLAYQFLERAFEVSNNGVAVIVRSAFLEGKERFETLFKDNPPNVVAQFVERVPMCKGKYNPDISSATSYSWLVWDYSKPSKTELIWIPPCRKLLELKADFPIKEIEANPLQEVLL